MTRIKIISNVDIYRDPNRCVNQVSLATLENGDIVAVFNEERGRVHADNGWSSLIRSKDGGRTWDPSTKVTVLGCTEYTSNWDPAITRLSDGTLIVALNQRFRAREGRISFWYNWIGTYVLKSTDGGYTWSDPIPVNVHPMKHGGTRTGPLELPNGRLLLGLYGRLTDYEEYGGYEARRAYLVKSDDKGDTWEHFSTLAYDPAGIIYYQEPALVRLDNGTLVCMLRAEKAPSFTHDALYVTYSDDDGASWSLPKRLKIWGYPPHLLKLNDGRILLTYGYRRDEGGVKGLISEDGYTWDPSQIFTITTGGNASTNCDGMGGWHIGYPSTVQLEDGTILTAYHQYDQNNLQYIRATLYEIE